MSHNLTGLILKGHFEPQVAKPYDLFAIPLGFDLNLFPINHYYSAYWQYKLKTEGCLKGAPKPGDLYHAIIFPEEAVIATLVEQITASSHSLFTIIVTDYFGGIGSQWARLYSGPDLIEKQINTIRGALRFLDVIAKPGMDEFDTVGLDKIRSLPDYLEKYGEWVSDLDL